MKETGEDQESHGQTTSRSGWGGNRMKETGEDQEPHGQTTSRSGWWRDEEEIGVDQESHGQTTSRSGWEILEGMVEGERDRGRPRATRTDNIKEWMGNIGGNGGG